MFNGVVEFVGFGEIIIVCLVDDVDILCGDIIVVVLIIVVNVVKKLYVDLCWFDEYELNLVCKYVFKYIMVIVFVCVLDVECVFDVYMLLYEIGCKQIVFNDIGMVNISLQKLIVCDVYGDNLVIGVFILVDEVMYYMVVVGMICVFF